MARPRATRRIVAAATLCLAAAVAPVSALAAGHTSCGKPWHNHAGMVYTCELWPAGPIPVRATTDPASPRVGVLNKGGWSNWFTSQVQGPTYSEHGYSNNWYAHTTADNGRWGYVTEVYFAQGDDFERDARLPASPGSNSPPPTSPNPATRFRLLQMNMCMWGAKYYAKDEEHKRHGDCFPNPHYTTPESAHSSVAPVPRGGEPHSPFGPGYTAAERHEAARKRDSVVHQIERIHPDAATINEGCKGDLQRIVEMLPGYTFTSIPLGQGRGDHPRRCSVGRGAAVNAIIARGFSAGSKEGGYFMRHGSRAWLCAVSAGVRICTAHLSLPHQTAPSALPVAPDGSPRVAQPVECDILRSKLASSGLPTVFAGDTNYNHRSPRNCAPANFFGLRDNEFRAQLNSQSGMQQIYYSPSFTRDDSCGHMPRVAATDHKGFWLDLRRVSTPTRGASCTWRAVRPGS